MRRTALLLACLLCLVSCGAGPVFRDDPRPPADLAARDKAPPERFPAPPADPAPNSGTGPIDHTVGTTLSPLRRWYGTYTDHLIPSPDYGPLYPFVGQDWAFPEYDPYTFGLMTGDGTVVVDSVYTNASPLLYQDRELPVLALAAVPENWDGTMGTDGVEYFLPRRVTAAARDGSWVLEDWYSDLYAVSETEFLLSGEDGRCRLFDLQGKLLSDFTLDPALDCYGWWEGRCIARRGDEEAYFLVDARAGTALPLPGTTWAPDLSGGLVPLRDKTGLWGYIDPQAEGRWAIAPSFADAGVFKSGYGEVALSEETCAVIDRTGQILTVIPHPYHNISLYVYEIQGSPLLFVQYVRVYDIFTSDSACYLYDRDGTLLETLPEGTEALFHGEEPPLLVLPEGRCRWLGEETEFTLPPDSSSPGMDVNGQLYVSVGEEILYLDRRGRVTEPPWDLGRPVFDGDTGETYYISDPAEGVSLLYDGKKAAIAELENDWFSWYIQCRGGLIQCRKGQTGIVYNLEGEVLLRYPLRPFGWPPRDYPPSDTFD